jgi:hypothetical protein
MHRAHGKRDTADPFDADRLIEWQCDGALDGGRRWFGAAVPVPADWWLLLCKDAMTVRPN